jgi:5-methylcytosine-specific restriction protein B
MFPLTQEEGMRLLELAQVTPEEVGISTPEKKERTPVPCNFVTFHPSYAYEEFIEGLRPNADDGGDIRYEIQEGIFKQASREALNALLKAAEIDKIWQDQFPVPTFSPEERAKIQSAVDRVPCYLVIDEINRGDISRIFGELITLVEADKRVFCENEIRCILPYSKREFGIPPNLFIIGTMNTADRSISLMDIALRRRFGFIELLPDYDALTTILITGSNRSEDVKEYRRLAIQSLKTVNEKITEIYDRDHQIGHSYLVKLSQDTSVEDTKETLTNIWKFEIIPLLQEYFYDSPEKLLQITNNRFFEKRGSSFILKPEGDIIEALRAVTITK